MIYQQVDIITGLLLLLMSPTLVYIYFALIKHQSYSLRS